MKKLLVFGIIFLLVGMSIPSTGINVEKSTITSFDGNTLYVGGSGPGNYSTINSAVQDAGDGDTVFVYSGFYEEIEINIDKAILLIGEDKNTTIVDGNNDKDDILILTKNNITVQDITLQNAWEDGISIRSSNNKVYNCILRSNYLRGIVIADDCHKNIVSYCEFSGNYWGLEIQGWDEYNYNNVISCCTFNSGNVVKLNKAKSTLVTDCILNESELSIELSDGSTIANCRFYHPINNAIYFGSVGRDITIENCTSIDAIWCAMYVYDPQYNLSVRNCTFENCGSSGILFWSLVQDSEFYGCKFINSTYNGLLFTGGIKRVEITRCHFEGNDDGIDLGYINRLSKFNENNFINNNGTIVKGGLTTIFFCLNTYKNNYWDDWRGWGPYHVYGFLNWDWRPAKEPYDI